MKYKCLRCKKSFNQKNDLVRHEARKAPCKLALKCDNCGNYFANKSNLNRHINNHVCANMKHELEIKKLREELSQIKSGQTIINNTQIVNNTVHVQVRNFGEENMDYLVNNEEFINACLNPALNGARIYLLKVHFNPNHPENHNIKLLDASRKKFSIRKQDGWHPITSERVTNRVLSKGETFFYSHLENRNRNGEKISPTQANAYNTTFVYRDSKCQLENEILEIGAENQIINTRM